MDTRQRRQSLIRRLVGATPVRSQAALSALLKREGVACTQATLSRDLRELGMVKGASGYAEPGGSPPEQAGLVRAARALLLEARAAGTLVVIRTPPGGAPSLALELDRTPPEGVLGTVAGDDTVFAATGSVSGAAKVARRLVAMARAEHAHERFEQGGRQR
ncbi:MAG: arginine repressor [Phycisphaerales bacterium]|nr:arginine repressor [Phycisphaerales bacterium]